MSTKNIDPSDPGWLGYGTHVPTILPKLPPKGIFNKIDPLGDTGTQIAVKTPVAGLALNSASLRTSRAKKTTPYAETLQITEELKKTFVKKKKKTKIIETTQSISSEIDQIMNTISLPMEKTSTDPFAALSDAENQIEKIPLRIQSKKNLLQNSYKQNSKTKSNLDDVLTAFLGTSSKKTTSTSSDLRAAKERSKVKKTNVNQELILPNYQIIKLLGRGGMGEVYLANRLNSTGINVKCVLKTILKEEARDPELRKMFLDEARVISLLRHQNVVSVMDVGEHEGILYLAMEYVDGLDAGELVDTVLEKFKRELPLQHMLYIMREALKGLHHAHTALNNNGEHLQIVHRDISPGNILISRHGAVKIADFGVALAHSRESIGDPEAVAGKPHYFAPEIWLGAIANPKTDVFAMGITFWELLTSEMVFTAELGYYEVARAASDFHPKQLLENHLSIPDGLEDIVIRALHPNPEKRYQTALEFLEDINDFSYENGIRLLDAHFARFIEKVLQRA